jgi:hypothetical protein
MGDTAISSDAHDGDVAKRSVTSSMAENVVAILAGDTSIGAGEVRYVCARVCCVAAYSSHRYHPCAAVENIRHRPRYSNARLPRRSAREAGDHRREAPRAKVRAALLVRCTLLC